MIANQVHGTSQVEEQPLGPGKVPPGDGIAQEHQLRVGQPAAQVAPWQIAPEVRQERLRFRCAGRHRLRPPQDVIGRFRKTGCYLRGPGGLPEPGHQGQRQAHQLLPASRFCQGRQRFPLLSRPDVRPEFQIGQRQQPHLTFVMFQCVGDQVQPMSDRIGDKKAGEGGPESQATGPLCEGESIPCAAFFHGSVYL